MTPSFIGRSFIGRLCAGFAGGRTKTSVPQQTVSSNRSSYVSIGVPRRYHIGKSPWAAEVARAAYDRLASARFREHKCAAHLARIGQVEDDESFTARIRRLVSQGFKPKDAVELFLQEVALEFRNEPRTLARAKVEGEDFLRRVKAGLI